MKKPVPGEDEKTLKDKIRDITDMFVKSFPEDTRFTSVTLCKNTLVIVAENQALVKKKSEYIGKGKVTYGDGKKYLRPLGDVFETVEVSWQDWFFRIFPQFSKHSQYKDMQDLGEHIVYFIEEVVLKKAK